MADWTPSQVEDRLIEAADVLRRLPDPGVRGYFTTWPDVLHSTTDRIGREPAGMSRPRPSPAAISCMEEALDWLRFLEADDAKLVWARAEGRRWKAICWRFGISRATAHRRWQYGLSVIALRLNKRRVSAKRSMASVVEEAGGRRPKKGAPCPRGRSRARGTLMPDNGGKADINGGNHARLPSDAAGYLDLG